FKGLACHAVLKTQGPGCSQVVGPLRSAAVRRKIIHGNLTLAPLRALNRNRRDAIGVSGNEPGRRTSEHPGWIQRPEWQPRGPLLAYELQRRTADTIREIMNQEHLGVVIRTGL